MRLDYFVGYPVHLFFKGEDVLDPDGWDETFRCERILLRTLIVDHEESRRTSAVLQNELRTFWMMSDR